MLVCTRCSQRFEDVAPRWRCPCGGMFDYASESPPRFDLDALSRRPPTMWRYREALPPFADEDVVTLGEGMTPLVAVPWAGRTVHMKLDHVCPTGSFKDRGASMMVGAFRRAGVRRIVEDSSGNAGASVAAYAARAGIEASIYVPASASSGKKAQIAIFGAQVVEVPGTREDTTAAVQEAARTTFYGSHNWSPFFVQGCKTSAFETWEQLGGRAPDVVVSPTGYGAVLRSSFLGYRDLLADGRIERLPRLVAVQSDRCDPIVRAFEAGSDDVAPIRKRETIAEGISSSAPLRGREVLAALRETDGVAVSVSDEEIWEALQDLGRLAIAVEPTSATAPAAVRKLVADGRIAQDAVVVCILTGSGLKATDKILSLRKDGVH